MNGHEHVFKKVEVLTGKEFGRVGPHVYAYVCDCGETGHPVGW